MLIGTVIGVLVIPGLYYLFALMASKGGKFIQDEVDEPLSEVVEHHSHPPVPHPPEPAPAIPASVHSSPQTQEAHAVEAVPSSSDRPL